MITPAHVTDEYLSWGKAYTQKENLSAPVHQEFPRVEHRIHFSKCTTGRNTCTKAVTLSTKQFFIRHF